MTKSAAEAEREVEASRGQLDRTVDALKQKMTPGQLFDEATHAMGGAGQQVLSKFVEQAKENPMPLAVMGLGLAWLMTSSGKRQQQSGFSRPYEPRALPSDRLGGSVEPGGLGEKVHDLKEKASDLLTGAHDKIESGISSVGESGRAAAQNLGSLASSAADRAGDYSQRAQQTFMDLLDREPLLIGALGLAAGVALGASLPATEAEDHLLGRARDRVLEKGKALAHDGLEQAGGVAQAAYGAVKSELQQSAGEGADVSQRVQDAAKAGAQAVKSELKGDPTS